MYVSWSVPIDGGYISWLQAESVSQNTYAFSFPVSMVHARNARDHDPLFGDQERLAFYDSGFPVEFRVEISIIGTKRLWSFGGCQYTIDKRDYPDLQKGVDKPVIQYSFWFEAEVLNVSSHSVLFGSHCQEPWRCVTQTYASINHN